MVVKTSKKRNPADVRAGINAGKIGQSSAAQRTGTKAEIADAAKGKDTAQQERLRATRRQTGNKMQAESDARNTRRGFDNNMPELRAPAVDNRPVEQEQSLVNGPVQQSEGQNAQENIQLTTKEPQEDESFFDRLGETITTGEFSEDPGFNRAVNAKDLAQIAATGVGIGAASIALSAGLATISGAGPVAAVSKAAAGTTVKNTATKIATNTVTAAKTTSFLSKIYAGAGLAAGLSTVAFTLVGTYPFSGFIKEEALQQLGFTSRIAIDEGNLEAADAALAQEIAILNPTVWENVLAAIPFVNVQAQVKNFLEAAALDVEVKAEQLERIRAGELTPEEQGFADRATAQAERDKRFDPQPELGTDEYYKQRNEK